MLGGEGWIVEIDESCICKKRKYGRGDGGVSGRRRDQRWAFGLVERSRDGVKGRCLVFHVPDRTRPTLFEIINHYVLPGKCSR